MNFIIIYKNFFLAIGAYDFVSTDTLRMVEMYGKMFSKTEYFGLVIDTLISLVDDYSKTELGGTLNYRKKISC